MARKSRTPLRHGLTFAALLIVALLFAPTAAAAATHHYFAPVRDHRSLLVFKLAGVDPSEIHSAYLKTGGHRRGLSVRRVRAAARHGVLRLRVSKLARRHRLRRLRAHRAALSGSTLVIVTSDTATTSPTASTTADSSVSTFTPDADAYVAANRKKSNYGTGSELRVSGSPSIRSYLRLPVQGLANPVTRATLKLYATSSSSAGFDVRSVSSTSWSETGITYADAPGTGGVVTSSGAFSSGRWLSLDVTSLIKGNGAISVALTSSSADAMAVASRETGGNSPQLVVETSTAPALDTSAPTMPTGLSVTASTTTSITLAWNPSFDDVGVGGYHLYLNGASAGATSVTSHIFSGLACGTSYTLSVDAYDAAGNRSATASLGAATLGCAGSSPQYSMRGIYDRDFSATGFDDEARIGFNLIDSNPYADQMNQLAARGLKGFVWLGGYSNTTCQFNYSDDWVRSHVSAIAGNPGVGAYFIDDEPNATTCPNAPAQIKARSDLVKSLDPGPPTFMVDYKVDQFKLWAGKTDVLGLDHYPCSIVNGCDYSKIDAEAAEADRLGIRYWGVIQAHGDAWYKVPTPDELHQQFVHWRATHMEGYLVFAWHYGPTSSLWLANQPELQAQLAVENSS